MHLLMWTAFRYSDVFSFSLELLITGAVWKYLPLPAPFHPPAHSSCCCSSFLLGTGDRNNGRGETGENWTVTQLGFGESTDMCSAKQQGFIHKIRSFLPESSLKGNPEGSQQQNHFLASEVLFSRASINP